MSKATLKQIVEHLKSTSVIIMRTASRDPSIQLHLVEREPVVFAHWLSLILVSSPQIQVTFKAHFMLETAKKFAAAIYDSTPDEVSVPKATDFFREYCSLVSGDLKIALVKSEVKAAASLPILTRGFDEIFFTRPPGAAHFFWKLSGKGGEFFCSVQIEILREFKFAASDGEYESQKGEIEFFRQ